MQLIPSPSILATSYINHGREFIPLHDERCRVSKEDCSLRVHESPSPKVKKPPQRLDVLDNSYCVHKDLRPMWNVEGRNKVLWPTPELMLIFYEMQRRVSNLGKNASFNAWVREENTGFQSLSATP